jgi:hypothetical protein
MSILKKRTFGTGARKRLCRASTRTFSNKRDSKSVFKLAKRLFGGAKRIFGAAQKLFDAAKKLSNAAKEFFIVANTILGAAKTIFIDAKNNFTHAVNHFTVVLSPDRAASPPSLHEIRQYLIEQKSLFRVYHNFSSPLNQHPITL